MLDSASSLVSVTYLVTGLLFLYVAFALILPKSEHNLGRAYILRNQIAHARLLPSDSSHRFSYSTLSLLLSLKALETHSLDLARGWLFGYGGLFGRVTGIRPSAYLMGCDRKTSIRTKLEEVLHAHGKDEKLLDDAWMMTVPSYLGFEGINPLTVYFCYKAHAALWLVVLEIHNTFGERHAHVLEVGQNEDPNPLFGFDHAWTFGRQFHVSPFNDRSGYYICSIIAPTHPPGMHGPTDDTPRPTVRIHLHTTGPPSRLKLTAVLRAERSTLLSSRSLILALAQTPFALLLSFPRIAYHAYILHFYKRLNVFARPDPRAVDPVVEANLGRVRNVSQDNNGLGGGLGWQPESFLENWSRKVVYRFLTQRTEETGITVLLISANPGIKAEKFSPSNVDDDSVTPTPDSSILTIYYRTPKFFTMLLVTPSAEHALVLGQDTEHIFSASHRVFFNVIFSPSYSTPLVHTKLNQLTRSIRQLSIPTHISLLVPLFHPLDHVSSSSIGLVVVLLMATCQDHLERWIFTFLGARFVEGDEPWASWNRVGVTPQPIGDVGSARAAM